MEELTDEERQRKEEIFESWSDETREHRWNYWTVRKLCERIEKMLAKDERETERNKRKRERHKEKKSGLNFKC